MLDKLSTLSVMESIAFIATAIVMLSLTIMLPYKIMKEIKKINKS
jgi:hypothetical protein